MHAAHTEVHPVRCLQALIIHSRADGRCMPLQEECVAELHPGLQVLSPRELDWVDSYHKEVWEKVSPRVQDAKHAKILEWLNTNTQPLQRPAVAAGSSKEAVAV